MSGILASGGDSGISAVTSAITTLMSLVEAVISAVVSNVWLVIPFAAGFVFLALKVWRRLARGSKIS